MDPTKKRDLKAYEKEMQRTEFKPSLVSKSTPIKKSNIDFRLDDVNLVCNPRNFMYFNCPKAHD